LAQKTDWQDEGNGRRNQGHQPYYVETIAGENIALNYTRKKIYAQQN